jgi:hypothetical protein
MPALFGGRLSVAVAGNGNVVVTRSMSYRIDLLSPDGQPQERWTTAFGREAVKEADLVAYEKVLVGNAPQLADMDVRKSLHRAFRIIPQATRRPVLGVIVPDTSDRILIQRLDSVVAPYHGEPRGGRWDLIENGVFRGSVMFRQSFSPRVLRGRFVYGVDYDSSNLPSIVRYSIGDPL